MNTPSGPPPQLDSAPTLFLDFDGVLHRGVASVTSKGTLVAPTGVQLFEYATVLWDILAPYRDVQIILSTSWVRAFGFAFARDAIPVLELRRKVVGATFCPDAVDAWAWESIARGAQVHAYAERNSLVRWLALDDEADGFDARNAGLVHCATHLGLGDLRCVAALQAGLEQLSRCR